VLIGGGVDPDRPEQEDLSVRLHDHVAEKRGIGPRRRLEAARAVRPEASVDEPVGREAADRECVGIVGIPGVARDIDLPTGCDGDRGSI
jgi:hypothetical protein